MELHSTPDMRARGTRTVLEHGPNSVSMLQCGADPRNRVPHAHRSAETASRPSFNVISRLAACILTAFRVPAKIEVCVGA